MLPDCPAFLDVNKGLTGIDLVTLGSKSRSGRHTYLPTAITGNETNAVRELGAFLANEEEVVTPSLVGGDILRPTDALALLS